MKVTELGEINGDVWVFGGPYSNLQALEAFLESFGTSDGCTAICTGDLGGYCADPVPVIHAIRRAGIPVVAGNVERQLAAGQQDCGCGFAPGSTCDRLSAGWFAHLDAAVDTETRAWMADLPDILTFIHHGRRCAVIHGGVTDIARFLWPTSPDEEFTQEISALQEEVGTIDRVISGHSGVAFTRDFGRLDWINAGVIGLPPHDGRPQTRYAVLGKHRVLFERLDYDHQAARTAMEAVGLTQGYHRTLTTGHWPSEDVLPDEMRRHPPR